MRHKRRLKDGKQDRPTAGNYRLIRLLGEGGFAEVYLGEHIHLGTQAAIKVLYTQLVGIDMEQFRAEARTIAHLEHPYIVRILEFGVEDKTPFLVMSYAPNGTLRQRHPRGVQLPLATIISYVKQVADALQYAHDEKLIHRDIKPENMLLSRRNEVLLSDFGIATVAQSSRYQSTQDVIGTVAYMAPEQIQGKPRPASDQYSLGIVVYEWLSGDRPFHGSFTELCVQHMFAPPPSLLEKVPTVSSYLEQVILKALSKDPRQRFASIQEFASVLEQVSLSSQPASLSFSSSTQMPTQLAPTLAVFSSSKNRPALGTTLVTYRGHTDYVYALGWSPDGLRIASGGADTTVQIWDAATRQKIRYCNGHLLNGRSFGLYGAFPDIRHEDEYYNEYYPFKVHTVAWSPDGTRIASGGEDGTIQIWDVATARLIFLYDGHQDSERSSYDKDPRNVFSIAWSPNGKQIASADEDGEIHVWDVATGQCVTTCRYPSQVNAVAWSPDGGRIASGGQYGGVQIWDAATGTSLFTYLGHVGSVPINAVAWSPDGARIASASYDVQIWQAT